MNNVEAASPWQRQVVADVAPKVEELAANVTMTIYHLGENRDRFIFTSFPEYVAANAELAAEIVDTLLGLCRVWRTKAEGGRAVLRVRSAEELVFPFAGKKMGRGLESRASSHGSLLRRKR